MENDAKVDESVQRVNGTEAYAGSFNNPIKAQKLAANN
jgi:hypothetical protein